MDFLQLHWHPTVITRILTGNSDYFVLCSFKTRLFFFNEQVLFTILRYDCNHFHAVKIVSYHLDTFHTTAGGLQDFSFTPEYVKNGYH